MNRRRLLAVSSALLAGAMAGCTTETNDDTTNSGSDDPGSTASTGDDSEGNDPDTEPDIDDEHLAELVGETNGFAFDLYRELLTESSDENLFSSPVSISIALAMTYAGARGQTREQMKETLRYTLDDQTLHETFDVLQRRLTERGGQSEEQEEIPFELSIANAVWGQEEYPFRDEYLDTLDAHYGGGLREVDYTENPEQPRQEINDWVADETADRIEELLPSNSLSTLTRLVLVNAVYFLANWKHPFSEERTTQQQFTALDGNQRAVPMMSNQRQWQYAEVGGAQAVDLPYVGEDVSMLVVLPPDGEFEAYEQSLDSAQVAEIVEALEAREGTVSLPRFEFESSFKLGTTLEAMGMSDAFKPGQADFSGIVDPADTGGNLSIDEVYHDTFVSVDEDGTEAAAATAVVIEETSAPANPFELVADRPFLFAIRDRPTGTVLFVGRVTDPADWE